MLHIFANWITDNPLWRIINLSVLPKLSSITIFEYKSAEHAGSDAFDYCEIINFKEELCKLKNGIKLEEKRSQLTMSKYLFTVHYIKIQ